MNVRDWKRFLEGRYDKEIAIAQVSQEIADHLGATSRKVWMQQACALKAVKKHGLGPEHLPLIFEAVDYGIALAEPARPLSLTFLHHDTTIDPEGDWYQASIKRGGVDKRLFLSTFHRSDAAEVRRKRRKYPLVRDGR